jgi:hypothetical protein
MVKAPAKFIPESVDGFGSYYTRDLCYGVFWGNRFWYAPFLDNFDDIIASMLLKRENVQRQNCED